MLAAGNPEPAAKHAIRHCYEIPMAYAELFTAAARHVKRQGVAVTLKRGKPLMPRDLEAFRQRCSLVIPQSLVDFFLEIDHVFKFARDAGGPGGDGHQSSDERRTFSVELRTLNIATSSFHFTIVLWYPIRSSAFDVKCWAFVSIGQPLDNEY
jgi:hypothetical protein